MPDPAPDVPPQSFEAALAELESLVGAMESGELSLEESIAAHRRGMALTRYCQQALAQAQQQVRILEAETLASFPNVQPDR